MPAITESLLGMIICFIAFFAVAIAPFFIYNELRKLVKMQREQLTYIRILVMKAEPGLKLPGEK